MKLVHWPLMGGLLHLVQRGADFAGLQPAQAPPRCTESHPPTATIPITVLLYNGPLLCSFNVVIKGLTTAFPACCLRMLLVTFTHLTAPPRCQRQIRERCYPPLRHIISSTHVYSTTSSVDAELAVGP